MKKIISLTLCIFSGIFISGCATRIGDFSNRGHSIIGDSRYGSRIRFHPGTIALHTRSLTVHHPTTKKEMHFTAEPDNYWPAYFR